VVAASLFLRTLPEACITIIDTIILTNYTNDAYIFHTGVEGGGTPPVLRAPRGHTPAQVCVYVCMCVCVYVCIYVLYTIHTIHTH
jgi:hypothetical protein